LYEFKYEHQQTSAAKDTSTLPEQGIVTQLSPPAIVLPNLKDKVRKAAKIWRVNCENTSGPVVTAQDEQDRMVSILYYGPDRTFRGQATVTWQSSADDSHATVDVWDKADQFVQRVVYHYDRDKNPTEIRKFDRYLNLVATADVQRKPNGRFLQILVSCDGRTTSFYQPDDPVLAEKFPFSEAFAQIPKQIDPPAGLPPTATATLPPPQSDTFAGRLARFNNWAPLPSTSSNTGQLPTVLLPSTSSAPTSTSPVSQFRTWPPEAPVNTPALPSTTPGLDRLYKDLDS
jgi:hypothetical protein